MSHLETGRRFSELLNALRMNAERSPWAKAQGVRGWCDGVVDELMEFVGEVQELKPGDPAGLRTQSPRVGRAADELGDVFWNLVALAVAFEHEHGVTLHAVLEAVEKKLRRRKPWIFDRNLPQPKDAEDEARMYMMRKAEVG